MDRVVRNQYIGLALLALATLAVFYYLGNVLWLFLLAIIISYILTPAVSSLTRTGLTRGWATAIILLLFITLTGLMITYLVPLLYHQALDLINNLPAWKQQAQDWLQPYVGKVDQLFSLDMMQQSIQHPTDGQKQVASSLLQTSQTMLGHLIDSGRFLAQSVGQSLLVLVLTFYTLNDWPQLLKNVEELLPRKAAPTIIRLCRAIDKKLSLYFRGQLQASLLTGLCYGAALGMIGVSYGFTLGFVIGLLSFFPYFTLVIGSIISLFVAYFDFGINLHFWLVLATFMFGQLVEGNVIAKLLVGDKLGMHPLTMLFAVLAGGSLFGFFGALIAIPTAASLSVVGMYFLDRYKTSDVYRE